MVEERSRAMPVISPVAPTRPKSSEKADTKSNTKAKADAAPINPGLGIPAGVSDDRRAIDQPGIIGGHVPRVGIGRLNDDRAALRAYFFLFVAVQIASVAGLLTQGLHRIGHILRLADICIAERRSPREVLVHIFENPGKLRHRPNAGTPLLLLDSFRPLFSLPIQI